MMLFWNVPPVKELHINDSQARSHLVEAWIVIEDNECCALVMKDKIDKMEGKVLYKLMALEIDDKDEGEVVYEEHCKAKEPVTFDEANEFAAQI